MITITPYLKKRLTKDKFGVINIRITENRKSIYKSLNIRINESHWNPLKKTVRVSKEIDYESINNFIQEEIEKIKKERKSIVEVKELKDNDSMSYLNYFKDYTLKLKSLKKLGTYKRYNTTYLHLLNFKNQISKSDIKFSSIDYKFIEDFDNYLLNKGLKKNSRNNYLICFQKVFRLALKEKVFKTYEDPFLNFTFKRESIEKRRLSFGQIQCLISEPIDFNSPNYETRVKFLFQIFGQGLRVSDLFTLRFNNIDFDSWNSRIHFFQFKTKKKHSVQLSIDLMKQIYYFTYKEKYFDYYYKRKYSFIWKEKEYKFTLPHIEKQLNRIKGISIKASENEKKDAWEIISQKVYGILSFIYQEQLKSLREFALKQPNKFLVPALNEKLFDDIIFNDSTILNQKQYNQLQSVTTMYNRDLKKLEPYTNTIIRITSHTPRHTYTNLLLSNNTDVYSISKSLGHSKLSITESYLNDFDTDKIDDDNSELFRKMNLDKISLKKE